MNRTKSSSASKRKTRAAAQKLPAGWDEARVRRVLDHYERQTPAQAAAEDESAYRDQTQSLVAVPVDLVPAVRKLIAERAS